MNFKEQMQEKTQNEYPSHYTEWEMGIRYKAYIYGSQAALSSDLVKGLVDALENLLNHHELKPIADSEDYHRGKRGDYYASTELKMILYQMKTALTNFKQEVKSRI